MGNLEVNQPGILIVDGKLLNQGLLTVDGQVQSGQVIDNLGELRGHGTIQADVLNSALLAPGDGTDILTIAGNFTQDASGVLQIEVAGMTPGTEHDQLIVQGTATLGGTLNIVALPGLFLQPGDVFNILLADLIVGTFDTIILPQYGQNQPMVEVPIDSTSVRLVGLTDREPPPNNGEVPAPATFALLLMGALGMGRGSRRRI
jgi:hypothetical protein